MIGANGAKRSVGIWQEDMPIMRPTGKPNSRKLRQLVEWQGFRCALTGDPITPENCEIDHIVPLSKGGENAMENLQVVLTEVNRAKNTMTQEEFVEMCCKVASPNRSSLGQ